MRSLLAGFVALATTALAATASAQYVPPPAPVMTIAGPDYDEGPGYDAQASSSTGTWSYFGAHPIAWDQGGGYCHIAGAHQHVYPVFDEHLYRWAGGAAYFVGDPTDFGYTGATVAYVGAHPIDVRWGGGHCHMGWNHRHSFAPVGAGWALRGGAYAWGGGWAPSYWVERPRYVGYYDGYYRRHYAGGAYYRLRPPHVYIGLGPRWRGPWGGPRWGGWRRW